MNKQLLNVNISNIERRISRELKQEELREGTNEFTSPGWVYALESKGMPGLLKIGYTRGSVAQRAADISRSTGVPLPLTPVWQASTLRPEDAEKALHSRLAKFRVNNNREFFKCSTSDISSACPLFAHESRNLASTALAVSESEDIRPVRQVQINSDLIDSLSELMAGTESAICDAAISIAIEILTSRLESDKLSFTYKDGELVDHADNQEFIKHYGDLQISKEIKAQELESETV